jgi:hypothetical protein
MLDSEGNIQERLNETGCIAAIEAMRNHLRSHRGEISQHFTDQSQVNKRL